jgi:ElaB/YqjD/DUF883 family membrane-anchored ribosome-binding protein
MKVPEISSYQKAEVVMAETSNGKDSWVDAIEKAKHHFNQGWNELGKAAELAKEKGADVWGEAQQKGQEVWTNARARGMEKWEDARDNSREAVQHARERGEEAVEDAEKLVKKYPGRAVGLSVFLGVLLGALLSKDKE